MGQPLATLDRCAKCEILPCLKRLNDKLAVPMVYIRHDMAEIEHLADHLMDGLTLREFHEGGWVIEQLQMVGRRGQTYTSVELKGWHTGLLPIRRPNHDRGRASANTKVFSRHLAGAAGDELVVHARALS